MAKTTVGSSRQGIGWLLMLTLGLVSSGLALSQLAAAQTMDPTEPADPTEPVPKGPAPKAPANKAPAPKAPAPAPEAAAGGGDAAEGGGDAAEEEVVEEAPEPEPAPPPAVEEEGSDALAPSTRPWLAEFGVGPNIWMLACGRTGPTGGLGCSGADGTTQVKMRQVVGYHFSGDGEGFAMGLSLEEAFGSSVFRFQPGVRLWGDIPVADDLAVYITPYGQLGYALWHISLGGFGSATAHFFNWQVGAKARIVLGDRWELSFTPLGFDWSANDDGMIWTYDISFGFGATF